MNIDFTREWVLFLYPLLIFIIYSLTKGTYQNKSKKTITILLRSAFLLCLILALADMSIVKASKDTTTVYLSDLSNSNVGNIQSEKDFILKSTEDMTVNDKVGSVIFGKEGYLDQNIRDDLNTDILNNKANGNYTDMEQGLMKALSIMPDDTNKRIVILTDGKENKGDFYKYVEALKTEDIDIKVKLYESSLSNEVYVDKFNIPQKLNLGEQFDVGVNIYSTIDTESKVTLLSEGQVKAVDNVKLSKGMNRFVMKDTVTKMGFVNYEVLIEPSQDNITINNSVQTYTLVETSPKILITYDKYEDAQIVENIVRSFGVEFDSINSKKIPTQMKNLLDYKSIVMCNVSAENLDQEFLNNIEIYVKDFGGGLVALGGEDAFALGGYYKTNLEKVLPVNMHMKGIKNKPKMAMMLILDKSGSMSGMNLRLAKEAAIRSVEVLEDRDEIGVVAFDDVAYQIVELQTAKDREKIKQMILGIQEGGGTSILPALESAYEKIKNSKAEIKHIILLTDGQAETSGYDSVLNKMNDGKITLTTVGIGDGADYSLLEFLAKEGKGRSYVARDGSSIPRIFAKEAFLSARSYLNNQTFTPIMNMYHPILSSVYESGLPKLYGYVGSSEKDTATVLLSSPMNDPILAIWQYGLGKTVAWTSDLSGQWSKDFTSWNNNNLLWRDIIQFTIEDYDQNPVSIDAQYENGDIKIILNSVNKDRIYDASVQVKTPTNQVFNLELQPIKKGVYEGSFSTSEIGAFMIKGLQMDSGEVVGSAIGGVTVPYSEEYKIVDNEKFKENIIKLGGQLIDEPSDVFKEQTKETRVRQPIFNLLIILAMILWLLDIAMRRLNIVNKIMGMIAPVIERGSELFINIRGISKRSKNKYKEPKKVPNSDPDEKLTKDISKPTKKPSKGIRGNETKRPKRSNEGIDTDRLLGSLKDRRKGE